MGIGTGIFLLVLGGILAFGVKDSWETFDLTAIGYICMAAGALAIVLTLVMQNQRPQHQPIRWCRSEYDNTPGVTGEPGPGETVVREERRDPGV